jgi:AcrR family transcriptional regulator
MSHKTSKDARRGSAELWIEAAYQTLLDGGVDGVKILLLAKKLKLSRTSFYWFFGDREKLLTALIARWRDKNTGAIVRQAGAYAETIAEAMLNIFDCWLDRQLFDAKFEFAVRSWALQSREILEEVQASDQRRIEAISDMLFRFGHDSDAAEVRARTTYLTQIGYISMQSQEDLALRMKRIPKYVEIFTGQIPQERELSRFHARHGFTR